MTTIEIINEIFQIVEKEIMKRKISSERIDQLKARLSELIIMLPEGDEKNRVLSKLKDKKRFCYLINDTGNNDFTGYGGNFW